MQPLPGSFYLKDLQQKAAESQGSGGQVEWRQNLGLEREGPPRVDRDDLLPGVTSPGLSPLPEPPPPVLTLIPDTHIHVGLDLVARKPANVVGSRVPALDTERGQWQGVT